jgi:hypothetical protein
VAQGALSLTVRMREVGVASQSPVQAMSGNCVVMHWCLYCFVS